MGTFLLLMLGLVAVQRLLELGLAQRNLNWALEQGATEYGREHYPLFFGLHLGWMLAIFVEGLYWGQLGFLWPLWLLLFLAAQGLRYWAIRSLGPYWNTRILVVPGAKPVTTGPYKYLRHPNYVAVAVEIFTLPLVFGAWFTAIVFTILNALLLLRLRIPEEERAWRMSNRGKGAELPRPEVKMPQVKMPELKLPQFKSQTPNPDPRGWFSPSLLEKAQGLLGRARSYAGPLAERVRSASPFKPQTGRPKVHLEPAPTAPDFVPAQAEPKPEPDSDGARFSRALNRYHHLLGKLYAAFWEEHRVSNLAQALREKRIPASGRVGGFEYTLHRNTGNARVEGYELQWDLVSGGWERGAEAQALWVMTRDHPHEFGKFSDLTNLRKAIERLKDLRKFDSFVSRSREADKN